MRVNIAFDADGREPGYEGLYKVGGVAAWVAAALMLAVVVVFTVYPQPDTVSEWFELFQENRVIGLLDFWGLEVLLYVMFVLAFLALYFALKKDGRGAMAIGLAFALLGAGIFLATNNPFAMLSLSDQYGAATTEAERSILLAAGQALLSHTGQRVAGGFNTGLLLVSLAGLISSAVMLRNGSFGKATAYVGIAGWGLSLADYVRQMATESAAAAVLVILPSTLLLVAWFVLAGRKLYRIGRR